MKKVIFICTGNTCRSPMAEGIFKSFNMDFEVKSAGLFADGSAYCDKSVAALGEIGITIGGNSKNLTREDLDADVFFCMSNSHREILLSYGVCDSKIKVLNVSDPYGGDLDTYRMCRDEILNKLSVYNFKVCPADKGDIPAIAEIEKACFSAPWSENAIDESMQNGTLFWVAKTGEHVLGYAGLSGVLDEGYITNVATLPEYRGVGVARAILNTLVSHCEDNGFSFVTLEVRESNLPAIRLYETAGFLPAGKRKNFYSAPREDAIIMTKVIDSENTQH